MQSSRIPPLDLWAFEDVYRWTEKLRALALLDFQPTSEKLEAALPELPMMGVPAGEIVPRWITPVDLVGTVIVVERYLPSGKTPSGEQPPEEDSKERPRIRRHGTERFVAEPPAVDQVYFVADRVLAWWAHMWPQLDLAKLARSFGIPELTSVRLPQPARRLSAKPSMRGKKNLPLNTANLPLKETPARRRRRSKQDRVKPYIAKCFPNGIAGFTPTEVVYEISQAMQKDGLKPTPHSTILRAAGLKK